MKKMKSAGTERIILAQASDRAHQLEEYWLHSSESLSATLPDLADYDAIIVFGIAGSTRWAQPPIPGAPLNAQFNCTVEADQFIVLPTRLNPRLQRLGSAPAHLLLWRFNMSAIRTIGSALGQFPKPPAVAPGQSETMQGGHPRSAARVQPMTPALQSLVRSIRTAPRGPMQAVWYAGKLLELAALICPAAQPSQERPAEAIHPAVLRAREMIHLSYAKSLTLGAIARSAGMSASHLNHLFSSQIKETPIGYLRRVRLENAARLLKEGTHNVSEAAYAVGYTSLGQFSNTFRSYFGYPPGKHRGV